MERFRGEGGTFLLGVGQDWWRDFRCHHIRGLRSPFISRRGLAGALVPMNGGLGRLRVVCRNRFYRFSQGGMMGLIRGDVIFGNFAGV